MSPWRSLVLLLFMTTMLSADDPVTDRWITAGQRTARAKLAYFESALDEGLSELAKLPNGKDPDGVRSITEQKILLLKSLVWSSPLWIPPTFVSLDAKSIGYIRDGQSPVPKRLPSISDAAYEKLPQSAKRAANASWIEVYDVVSDVRIFQILSDSELLIRRGETIAYVKNFDTKGKVDKSTFPDIPLIVTGTRRYDAVAGSNTVFELEPITDELQKKLDAAVTEEIRHPPRFREWSDISKQFKIEAELVSFEKNTVTLRKKTAKSANYH